MDFKTFFRKQMIPSYFVSVTCITLAMAVIGTLFEPDVQLSYGILFSPFIFGLIASLIQLVNYSPKEMTQKQAIVREILHIALLEAGIMSVLYWGKALTSVGITIALVLSILVIYAAVAIIIWMNDKRITETINKALKELQQRRSEIDA